MSSRGYPITKRMREERRNRADKQTKERALLSPREQIAKLDLRLGVGQGAVRERARLSLLIK